MLRRRKADTVLDQLFLETGGGPDGTVPDSQEQPHRRSASRAAERETKRRDRRTDLTVAALGVTLGLICALFPWYIFFNPDEFGVRAMKFGGSGAGTQPIVLGAQPDRVGAPVANQDVVPKMELDLLATGSSTKTHEDDTGEIGLTEQPFPPPVITFKVVQIANGRAMLEDDTGLFVVEPGSILPDGARVETIGERDGRQVLVTAAGAVLGISE